MSPGLVHRSTDMKRKLLGLVIALATGLPVAAGTPGQKQATKEIKEALSSLNAAFAKGDAAAVKRLLTADHVAVTTYYGGPQTRDEQLASLKDLKLTAFEAGELKVTLLGKDVALVTYPLKLRGTYKGQA